MRPKGKRKARCGRRKSLKRIGFQRALPPWMWTRSELASLREAGLGHYKIPSNQKVQEQADELKQEEPVRKVQGGTCELSAFCTAREGEAVTHLGACAVLLRTRPFRLSARFQFHLHP